VEETVRENLRTLHKSHRLRILDEKLVGPKEEEDEPLM
jgi:hypothetical protein